MTLGFIGLGTLGRTIAARLSADNRPLIVWNRTEERADGLAAAIAANPADLIHEADTVLICLRDSEAVEAVLHGRDGLLASRIAGKLIVDTTTHHPARVGAVHDAFREAAAHYLEAPVLGHVQAAAQGTLTVLASGERAVFDRALPLLETIGRDVFYLGEPGTASRVKLVNDMVAGSFLATIAEALLLGERCGLSRERMLQILAGGAGNSTLLALKWDKLAGDDYAPQLSASVLTENLDALEDMAREWGRPLIMGTPVREMYHRVVDRGQGELDIAVVYEALAE